MDLTSIRGRCSDRMIERAGTVLLAALFATFASAHCVAFRATHRSSLVLALATEALLATFIVARRDATAVSFAPGAWVTSLGGTLAPMLLRPVDGVGDHFAAVGVQCLGTALSCAAIASLNRSIGLLPAHRGIRKGGMYRFVRHPLYCAYTVTALGYVGNHLTFRNLTVAALGLSCQIGRLRNEERLLSKDPEYVAYMRKTRWRLLPFVF